MVVVTTHRLQDQLPFVPGSYLDDDGFGHLDCLLHALPPFAFVNGSVTLGTASDRTRHWLVGTAVPRRTVETLAPTPVCRWGTADGSSLPWLEIRGIPLAGIPALSVGRAVGLQHPAPTPWRQKQCQENRCHEVSHGSLAFVRAFVNGSNDSHQPTSPVAYPAQSVAIDLARLGAQRSRGSHVPRLAVYLRPLTDRLVRAIPLGAGLWLRRELPCIPWPPMSHDAWLVLGRAHSLQALPLHSPRKPGGWVWVWYGPVSLFGKQGRVFSRVGGVSLLQLPSIGEWVGFHPLTLL